MRYYLRNELAVATGIKSETLRFYEKIGVIPEPKRTSHGYRIYPESMVIILQFVKKAKDSGFSLLQIKEFFSALNGKEVDVDYLAAFIDLKLQEIKNKMADLENVSENLVDIKKNLYSSHECALCSAFNELRSVQNS